MRCVHPGLLHEGRTSPDRVSRSPPALLLYMLQDISDGAVQYLANGVQSTKLHPLRLLVEKGVDRRITEPSARLKLGLGHSPLLQ